MGYTMAGEIFRCAEKLFYSPDRDLEHSNEPFVFGGCGGINADSCPLSKYQIPTGIDTAVSTGKRDAHGRVIGQHSAFTMSTYEQLVENSEACKAEVDQDPPETEEEIHEKYRECISKEVNEKISHGLELVFGADTSLGYICGMAEHVKKNSGSLPGTCCIDTPYQAEDDNWGFEVSTSYE